MNPDLLNPASQIFARWELERERKFEREIAKGFRSSCAGVVAAHLAGMFGYYLFPSWPGSKVPRFVGWQEHASNDVSKIAFWNRYYAGPDCLIKTGRECGIWIMDIDGSAGRARLADLEKRYGPLPPTPTVISGRPDGGEHRWFKPTPAGPDLKNVGHAMIAGKRGAIDQRGRGGYAVCAGSLHWSGARYRFASGKAPDEVETPTFPEEWIPILDWADEIHKTEGTKRTRGHSRVRVEHDPSSYLIGDGDGYGGFNLPIYKNAIRYFINAGIDAPGELIIETLRKLIIAAPKYPGRCVARYLDGPDLPRLVNNALQYVKENRQ